MSRSKTKWTQSWQYQRIMEILEDYWLSCPDEAFVMIEMYFRKRNGEEQLKHITWHNPNFKTKDRDPSAKIVSLADIADRPAESFYEEAVRLSSEFLASIRP